MSPNTSWYRLDADGNALCIFVHIQPHARTTEVVGLHDGRLKIRVAAPALDGRANALLMDYLRRRLDLPASSLSLVQGLHSRSKTLRVSRPTAQTMERLAAWGAQ